MNNQEKMNWVRDFIGDHTDIVQICIEFMEAHPNLQAVLPDILTSYLRMVECFDSGNALFICGNGGSFADAMHISGEMLKSFTRKRPLKKVDKERFENIPNGSELAEALEYGLPVHVLGLNHSLFSALENDNSTRYIGFAQELFVKGKEGDLFLGISTSGNAMNVRYAAITAKTMGMTTVSLTGETGGELSKMSDICIRVPSKETAAVQEMHQPVYHMLCRILEAHYF